ncbi:ABC transporter permease subunit [Paraburkholderia sp. DGU8]|uniref:ABC transporter permease subunit n=1 Tax=Paraburkholderia sp. DGU8 TaxID=3161997 RepID=UPI0034670CAB
MLDPLIEFYRPIPPLACLPLIVILFDIDEFGKVLLAYLAIFAPIAISTANGGCNVDTTNFRATQALGATGRQTICQVVLPHALPRHPVRDTNRPRRRLVYARGGGACRRGARPPLHGEVATPPHRRHPCWHFGRTSRLRALHRRLVPWCEKGN